MRRPIPKAVNPNVIDTGDKWDQNENHPLDDIKAAMKMVGSACHMVLLPNGSFIPHEEFKRYSKFKPSFLQRLVWFFWPTKFSVQWTTIQGMVKN